MSDVLVLQRVAYTPLGVFGKMEIAGRTIWTVELPWLDNQRRVSCIPEGEYTCRPRRYFKGGYDAIEICDVPERSEIMIHKGNTIKDLAGCIAPGMKLGVSKGTWAVLDSAGAFALLMKRYGGREFRLRIEHGKA